jgi:DNA-binding GntR family transcriptional regulator
MTLTAPRTIAGQVAERLKAEILAGERAPGTRLRQVEIARSYGVSTTPVREALATLQREGLVRHHAQRGAVVFLPSVDDLRHHYEIRAALESLAAAKAADHFEAAWARPLEQFLDEMREAPPAARYLALN